VAWTDANSCLLVLNSAPACSKYNSRKPLLAISNRTIKVLRLFSLDRPAWTVEKISAALGLSISSAYRYVSALEDAGFLTAVVKGRYTLGPAIMQLDRQVQLTDPLLSSARAVMSDLLGYAPSNAMVVLCRRFRETVLCVHQVSQGDGLPGVSFERGRPMPVFLGATAKVILAHVPTRDLKRMYRDRQRDIEAAKLGRNWDEFAALLAAIRKSRHAIAYAEVDPDRVGIAAPILDSNHRILGSITYVIAATDGASAGRLAVLAVDGAREIENNMSIEAQNQAARVG
jgi:DNA-binding IclR family transcriptional regulator